MPQFYETSEFRELEREWYDRLSKDGFYDLEREKNGDRILKEWACTAYKKALKRADQKAEYFQLLHYHLYTYEFTSSVDKYVMWHWADGWKIATIVRGLMKDGISINRNTVRFVIRRYEHAFGIRFWSLRDRYLTHE